MDADGAGEGVGDGGMPEGGMVGAGERVEQIGAQRVAVAVGEARPPVGDSTAGGVAAPATGPNPENPCMLTVRTEAKKKQMPTSRTVPSL